MERIKDFLSRVWSNLKFSRLITSVILAEVHFEIRRRIRISRRLNECSDTRSREREKARIIAEEDAKAEIIERRMHERHRLTIAMIEMLAAVAYFYDYPENKRISAEKHNSAHELFKKSKDEALMYARWLIVNGETHLEKFVTLLEAFEIDTYENTDERDDFLDCLIASCTKPT